METPNPGGKGATSIWTHKTYLKNTRAMTGCLGIVLKRQTSEKEMEWSKVNSSPKNLHY